MNTSIDLFSSKSGEIYNFLLKFYQNDFILEDAFHWKKYFDNPIEMIDLISVIIDNNDKFNIAIWISIDKNVLINVNSTNANNIIKYLLERFPY